MKKFINSPESVVTESMKGFAAAHSDMAKVYYNPNYLVRANAPVKGKSRL